MRFCLSSVVLVMYSAKTLSCVKAMQYSTVKVATKRIDHMPRLYIEALQSRASRVELSSDHVHYARNVLRLKDGDHLRIFNADSGEWLTVISQGGSSKKGLSLNVLERLKEPGEASRQHLPCRLLFAPIKKTRMKMLLEKATELGVTQLQPIVTQNTQFSADEPARYTRVLIESAEQCERLTIPVMLSAVSIVALQKLVEASNRPLLICAERSRSESSPMSPLKAQPFLQAVSRILDSDADPAFDILVGPEGGFTRDELVKLAGLSNVCLVSLGPTVLRAETAAICALATVACAVDARRHV
jgi:16S rRNA (uracil1498-N3)-methyltransferase